MFVINGDLYDRLLKSNSPEWGVSVGFAYRVLDLARIHNVAVRVLEGTPSHDNKQPKIFENQAKAMIDAGVELDFKYVQDMTIEFHPRFGLSFLYIPDEWRTDCADTYEAVLQKMREHSMTHIDYAFMHGQFDYQLPDVVKPHLTHKVQDYKSIIKKACFISHIHTHSINDYIYAPGSFDRLRHGEPEKKGFIIAQDTLTGVDAEFVINTDAFEFATIKAEQGDINDALAFIQAKLSKIKPGARIKVITTKASALYKNEKVLNQTFLGYTFTVGVKETKESIRRVVKVPEVSISAIVINENTITDLLHSRIVTKVGSASIAQRAIELLRPCL
jgi:hypothetical protein